MKFYEQKTGFFRQLQQHNASKQKKAKGPNTLLALGSASQRAKLGNASQRAKLRVGNASQRAKRRERLTEGEAQGTPRRGRSIWGGLRRRHEAIEE